MANNNLHPSVEKFKVFVRENPKIIQEVRRGRKNWQELYEDWFLLGEEDPKWDEYRSAKNGETASVSSSKKTDWMSYVTNTVKNIDPNQMQEYIHHASQALAAIQGVITQFQGRGNAGIVKPGQQKPASPFVFKKD
ncbi:YlbD family protein [Bacillus sp. 03113]|uniref:YlbD family protein n=1 Tax=Bacillus sp. 03113 TaxID=2578211 RepID=UPI0011439EFC|nr:YlbD family protein [Bacillus sp. 03113]